MLELDFCRKRKVSTSDLRSKNGVPSPSVIRGVYLPSKLVCGRHEP